jgi:hypothetical protein
MATKARLHWFWRGAIAVLLGALANAVILRIAVLIIPERYSIGAALTIASMLILPALPSLAVYIHLSDLLGSPPSIGRRRRSQLVAMSVVCSMICNILIIGLANLFENLYGIFLAFSVLTSLGSLAVYRVVVHFYGRLVTDGAPRCPKCGYILRGLSEPRCPECGEAI